MVIGTMFSNCLLAKSTDVATQYDNESSELGSVCPDTPSFPAVDDSVKSAANLSHYIL